MDNPDKSTGFEESENVDGVMVLCVMNLISCMDALQASGSMGCPMIQPVVLRCAVIQTSLRVMRSFPLFHASYNTTYTVKCQIIGVINREPE